MKLLRYFICLSLLLCCVQPAFSQVLIPDKNTVSIPDVKPYLKLIEGRCKIPLLDCLDTLKITHAHSFELIVKNQSADAVQYYLLYGVGYETPQDAQVDGVLLPKESLAYYLPLELAAYDEVRIVFTLRELDRMDNDKFSPKLLTERDFEGYQHTRLVLQPFFLGIFSFMIFFNSFFFIISRWRVYLKYALYIFISTLFFVYHFGFGQELNSVLRIPYNLVWILSSSIAIFYILFVRDFGSFKKISPRADMGFRLVMYFKFIQIPTEVILYFSGAEFIHSPLYRTVILSAEVCAALYAFINTLISGTARAKTIIVASFMLLVGSVAGQLNVLITLDKAVFIEAGMFIELLIFSVALAYIAKDHETRRAETTEQLLEQSREMERMQNNVSKELERQVKERTWQLEKKSEENELLLREIHHRVKNNLQIMSSLINLQSRKSKSASMKFFLQELSNKILSMGLVHERLYRKSDIELVNITDYLQDLAHKIISSLSAPGRVQIDFNFKGIKTISLDSAIILGLIHNELITNSVKHAKKNNREILKIQCGLQQKEGEVLYHISDNGPGVAAVTANTGFELRFVEQLVKKMKGHTTYRSKNGLRVEIHFFSESHEPINL